MVLDDEKEHASWWVSIRSIRRRSDTRRRLLGTVSGRPILAIENTDGVIAVDEVFTRSKECFAPE